MRARSVSPQRARLPPRPATARSLRPATPRCHRWRAGQTVSVRVDMSLSTSMTLFEGGFVSPRQAPTGVATAQSATAQSATAQSATAQSATDLAASPSTTSSGLRAGFGVQTTLAAPAMRGSLDLPSSAHHAAPGTDQADSEPASPPQVPSYLAADSLALSAAPGTGGVSSSTASASVAIFPSHGPSTTASGRSSAQSDEIPAGISTSLVLPPW
jgi:hypothetical protein